MTNFEQQFNHSLFHNTTPILSITHKQLRSSAPSSPRNHILPATILSLNPSTLTLNQKSAKQIVKLVSANVCFFPHKPESDDSIMYTDGLAELLSQTSASSLANDSGTVMI